MRVKSRPISKAAEGETEKPQRGRRSQLAREEMPNPRRMLAKASRREARRDWPRGSVGAWPRGGLKRDVIGEVRVETLGGSGLAGRAGRRGLAVLLEAVIGLEEVQHALVGVLL